MNHLNTVRRLTLKIKKFCPEKIISALNLGLKNETIISKGIYLFNNIFK